MRRLLLSLQRNGIRFSVFYSSFKIKLLETKGDEMNTNIDTSLLLVATPKDVNFIHQILLLLINLVPSGSSAVFVVLLILAADTASTMLHKRPSSRGDWGLNGHGKRRPTGLHPE